MGFPKDIIDIYEAKAIIIKAKESKQAEMSVFDGLKFRKVYSPIHNLRPQNKIRLRHRHLRGCNPFLPDYSAAYFVLYADSVCFVSACSEAVAAFAAWRSVSGIIHFRR